MRHTFQGSARQGTVTQDLQDEANEFDQPVKQYGDEGRDHLQYEVSGRDTANHLSDVTGQLQDPETRTHLEQADHLQMQAVAALVNEMNGWRCREQQRKCMAALQGIHEHLRAVDVEVPLLLTDVRPALLEVATGEPSMDYRTLVDEAESPDWVDLRRSLLETAVDAVAYMEAIDEVRAREPAAGATGVSAAVAGEARLSECSGSSAPARPSRRRTSGSRTGPRLTSRRRPALTGSSPGSSRT
jgi:hypothetical protein